MSETPNNYKRFRRLLPIVAVSISVPLILWDAYNTSVKISMGMAWDTGPPLWPYETPAILLYTINLPAHIVTIPLTNRVRLISPMHYVFVLPATILWWWLVGLGFDSGIPHRWRTRKSVFGISLFVSSVLFWGARQLWIGPMQWWHTYGHTLWSVQALRLIELLVPSLWCALLATFTAITTVSLGRELVGGLLGVPPRSTE